MTKLKELEKEPTAALRLRSPQQQRSSSLGLQRAIADNGQVTTDDVLALQRQAGNRAVTQFLSAGGPLSVQRQGGGTGGTTTLTPPTQSQEELEDGENIVGRPTGLVDNVNSNVLSPVLSGTALPQYSTNPTGGTPASNVGGVFNPALSFTTGAIGLGFSAAKVHKSRTGFAKLTDEQKKQAKGRMLKRDWKTSGTDTGTGAVNMTGQVLNTVAGGLENYSNVATSTSYSVGAAAGAVAIPLSAIQMGRYIRKAEKARIRARELEAVIAKEGEPQKSLAAWTERVSVLETQVKEANEEIDSTTLAVKGAKRDLLKLKGKKGNQANTERITLQTQINDMESDLQKLTKTRDEDVDSLNKAKVEQQQHQRVSEEMRKALNDASIEVNRDFSGKKTQQVSLAMIQAYALKKNNRGWAKKAINATAAALGLGGGVAALVATIAIAAGAAAGASVLMATPVGWALAGAAAAIGLAMAGYQAWKFFSKRWKMAEFDEQGNKRKFRERLGKTLAFWRKVGPSKREQYADALYEMAKDGADPVRSKQAIETIKALGLDWTTLKMDQDAESSKTLIAAKLGS